MRYTLPVLFATAILLAFPVSGQEDGCTDAEPCPWVIEVNDDGFSADAYTSDDGWSFVQGDVYEVQVFNDSNETHRLVLDGYGLDFDAPGWDSEAPYSSHGTITFDEAGTFTLTDETTGATATVEVAAPPATDGGDGTAGDGDGMMGGADGDDADAEEGNGSPGPAVVAVLVALAGAALVRRLR